MNDKQWETFFDLMDKIINMPNMTATEKAEMVRVKAEEHNVNLEEFATYCDE